MQFKDKVVWITGASSGYGAEIAKVLSEMGAKLILSARRENKLIELAQELHNVTILPLDLSHINLFKEKVEKAIEVYGYIDLVIHNGALAQNSRVLETNLSVERYLMEVDYFSYTELTRQILPHMIKRDSGHVVVISGLLAHINLPGRSTYAAAKAALIAYFGCLRAELLDTKIDITVIIPGAMQTGLAHKAIKYDGKVLSNGEKISEEGCSLTEAVSQTIQAISERRKFVYIGLLDKSYQLWKMMLNDPEQGIDILLEQLR